MYETFFQFERRPFAATPDPACFFHCETITSIVEQLTVCIEHGQGIGILTAPPGMGKTLLCQRLVKNLHERFRMIFLGNSNFPTRRSLLQAILFETGVEFSRKDEQELRHELRNVLRELREQYEAVVLIVDEAHSFEAELLEEIRTLVDLGDEGHPLVRVILSGQLELEERMTDRQFDAINQRISTHVYLESLSIDDSIGYLRHRVKWAGGEPREVFSEDAETIIARASCGVPRCLNQLADHSLLLGFAADEAPVSESTVREALEDLKQLPLHWNDVNDADRMIAAHTGSEPADIGEEADIESELLEDVWRPGNSEFGVDEGESSAENPEAAAEVTEPAEEPASAAVFEFGLDEPEDSPLDDHDEGDTLDEVAATINVAVPKSPQESAEPSSGKPSPPVSEISGVVLDISSQVCGVSECSEGVAGFGISSRDSKADAEPESDIRRNAESESESGAELNAAADQSSRIETGSAPAESSVFEFGADDVPEFDSEPTADDTERPELSLDAGVSDGSEESVTEESVTEEEELAAAGTAGEQPFESEISESDIESTEAHRTDADHPVTDEQDLTRAEADAGKPDDAAPLVICSESLEGPGNVFADSVTETLPVGRFDEVEIVSDPYAEIQEPLSSGIVWQVPPLTSELPHNSHSGSDDSRIKSHGSVDHPAEGSPDQLVDAESAGSPEAVNESDSSEAFERLLAEKIEQEEAIFTPSRDVISEEVSESIMQDWRDDMDCPEEAEVVEEIRAELSLFDADPEFCKETAEDQELEPTREIHPDRYIEAIVPMLGEIDDHCAQKLPVDSPERDAVDIEAELVDSISGDDASVEDEIGATVLDICLDAQWAIQQGGERAEEARESARPLAEAEIESDAEGYDIVQPEFPPENDFTSQVSEAGRMNTTESSEISADQERRQFSRLFSDLRRKQL